MSDIVSILLTSEWGSNLRTYTSSEVLHRGQVAAFNHRNATVHAASHPKDIVVGVVHSNRNDKVLIQTQVGAACIMLVGAGPIPRPGESIFLGDGGVGIDQSRCTSGVQMSLGKVIRPSTGRFVEAVFEPQPTRIG
jgi:hypothetical protein